MIKDNINEMEEYYAKRASEYENIYLKPERQEFIKDSKNILRQYFLNKNVLEIACGTGFWTEAISEKSTKITAVDINNEVLEIAKNKKFDCKIDFIQDDSYKLNKITEKYNSLFAGFWLSHVPKTKMKDFIENIHKKLSDNAMVVFIDNIYVEGISTKISRFDTDGNSFQIRKLKDNSEHEVLKNFYDEKSLRDYFENYCKEIEYHDLKYFWILKYHKK
jgi:demethylmenaquinone methyltransferase/2-methoxy-6-polyprenyl-1,4-benzoquinol methylase